MMKFFRKHNKKLLAVFMTLLMVVFIGGSALDSLLQPQSDRVVATSNLGEISYLDQRAAEGSTRILDAISGFDWRRPVWTTSEPLELVDWMLLTRETHRLAISPSIDAVRTGMQVPVETIARQIKTKPDHVLQALAQYAAVREAAFAIGSATAPSEAEIRAAARNSLEKVKINAVVLPATAFIDPEATFSEVELNAQFDKYREREPAGGLEFGYYVSPKVKVQYIRIDRDIIASKVRTARSKFLQKKAERYFAERRETDAAFRRPLQEDAQTYTAAGPDGEDPLVGPPEPRFLTWENAKDIAMDVVSRKEAETAAGRLADWLVPRLSEEWLDADRGDDGYKEVPDNAASLAHYEEVLSNVPRTIAYPEAVSIVVTDFFSKREAEDVPNLGRASFRAERSGALETLSTIAFRTKASIPNVPTKRGTNAADYLSLFQTSRYVLSDAQGRTYILRVVAAREGHVPESVDEVRERVTSDLRLLRAFEEAKARAEALRSCDASTGLQEAFYSDEELAGLADTADGATLGYFEPPAFARAGQSQGFGASSAGPGSAASTYVIGGLGLVPNDVIEGCFALEHSADRTAAFELKSRAELLVVEWLETIYPDGVEFSEQRETFVAQMAQARMLDAIGEWLTPANIRARNGFELVNN